METLILTSTHHPLQVNTLPIGRQCSLKVETPLLPSIKGHKCDTEHKKKKIQKYLRAAERIANNYSHESTEKN